MNRLFTLLLLLLCLSINTYAQLQPSGVAPGLNLDQEAFVTHKYHLTEDVNKLLAEDQAGIHYGIPLRVAVSVPVDNNFFSLGKWVELPDGGRFYRVQVTSPDAYALSIAFNDFYLPEHTRLFFYDAGKSDVIGGYTDKDNTPGKMFPGPIVTGDIMIIEYVEPKPELVTEAPSLHIMELAHFYRDPDNADKNTQIGTSWPCHINVNCSEGDDWQDVKRSVLRIYFKVGNGYGFCSGTLVNNTAQDGTPYVLTAYHCGGLASEEDRELWQFRFNFERPGCADEGTPPAQSIPGASLKALKTMDGGSDFQLLELNFLPPPHFEPYYSGWDRSVVAPTNGVGIHHPNGDVKKISTFNSEPETVNNAIVSGYHLAYRSIWNTTFQPTANGHSVTQGGSSGSGIFNNDKKLVGTLTGGNSTCSSPYGNNLYAKFHHHWESNGTTATEQLRPWLDPINTGQMTLDGIELYPAPSVQNLSATLDENLSVTLHWDHPSFETPGDQWYTNISNYTDVMNQTPERAVKFMITDQIEADTFYIKKLQHLFWEHPEYLWGGNTTFYFRIYDNDGETLLHESPQLPAINFQESNQTSIYQLEQALPVTGDFFVSIVPSTAGTPSSLAMEIQGATASCFGEAGNWQMLTENGKNYELMVSVMGSVTSSAKDEYDKQDEQDGKNSIAGEELITIGSDIDLFSKRMKYQETIKNVKAQLLNNIKNYKIFRDSLLIYETEDAHIVSFTDPDDLVEDESYTYFMTAIYDINPSNPHSPDHESGKSEEITVTISHDDDDDDTGLTDQETGDKMSVFPNPASGIVQIRLPETFAGGELVIMNLNGNTIKSMIPKTMTMIMDLSSLPGDVYFIRLVTEKKVYTQRLVLY